MSEQLNDTEPAYDVYIEEDRVTFVRRPEQEPVVESTPAQEPLRFVPIVMLGAHGLIALLALVLAAYLLLRLYTPWQAGYLLLLMCMHCQL